MHEQENAKTYYNMRAKALCSAYSLKGTSKIGPNQDRFDYYSDEYNTLKALTLLNDKDIIKLISLAFVATANEVHKAHATLVRRTGTTVIHALQVSNKKGEPRVFIASAGDSLGGVTTKDTLLSLAVEHNV